METNLRDKKRITSLMASLVCGNQFKLESNENDTRGKLRVNIRVEGEASSTLIRTIDHHWSNGLWVREWKSSEDSLRLS